MKTVLVDDGTWKRMKLRAVEQAIPLQTLVERALTAWLDQSLDVSPGDIVRLGAEGIEVHKGPGTTLDVQGPASAGGVGKVTTETRAPRRKR